jgi:AcrR family transcriptional regulator
MGLVSRQRTPTLQVRDALLRAARELLDDRGPDALVVRDIAARAGVSPMGVYNRFGSKDGVLDTLITQGFTELTAAVTVPPDEPLSQLAAGLAAYRDFALANPWMYRLMFDQPVANYVPSSDAMATAKESFGRLVDGVRLALAAGDLRPGDPVEIAQRLWGGVHGAVSLELRHTVFAADPAAHFTALVATLLRGLAADPDTVR